MGERVIKTGLSKKYKDMLDAVIGQMSDGYWEKTPMMRGYWKFVTTGTSGDEVTLEVAETSGARDGDRRIDNRFYGMSDDAVKKFFADKIKFLIKEEGIGKWDRDNESETDYLSYDKPRYRVKDCYYAYEILKGRNARKHPEYGDVEESNMKTNEGRFEGRLEDVAQVTGILTYNDAWRLDSAAEDDKGLRKKVLGLLGEFDDAAYDGDEDAMENIAKKLKELAGGVPAGESRANEKRVMDTSEPYEISKIKEYMAKKGWTWNFNDKNNHFWFTKDGHSNIEGDLVPWSAYVLTNGSDIYFGRSLRNWKADMKAIGINEANSNEAFDGWDDWEEIEGLEDTLDGIENLTYELRSCVRGAKTRCKDWKDLARYIKGLASNLEDAAELMAYKRDDEDESASEDRRGTDRYGHPVKRFTTKDLKGLDGEVIGGNDGNGDDAGTPSNFGLAYLDTTSIDAFSNNFSTQARDRFLHDLAQKPVSKKSIEDLLRKYELHKYGRRVGVRDFFPENGIAYLGTYGDDGLPYKTLCLRWGPALKK